MTDRSVVYRLRAELGSFQASMAQASASTRKLGTDMTALSKEGEKSRRGLESVGKVAGLMGVAAAAGLGAAILKAADFDQSMSKVQAATHESAANMDDLRQAALDAGAKTAFSATEAAAGIENLAKAGLATNDILGGGLMGTLDLAAAGELEVADAAEIAATTMNQFGLAGGDVSHIADVLAASAGKAQGEVTDMAAALKFVGPVAAQMGVSLEETAGSIAELASKGIVGEQAGTSLRGMLTALTSPSEVASKKMEELGISMYDAQGQFIGLEGIAGQLHETMGNLGQAERDEALGRIFGNEQITAARILYQGGAEAVADWTKKVDAAGFAAETAAIKQDNLRGDLEKLGGSLETALIGTGEGAQGPLRSLVQGAEDLVNAFNRLPGPAKDATAAMLGITAVIGGGLWFTTKTVSGVAKTTEALTNIGVPAGKASAAMKGLAKAGTGLAVFEGVILGLKALQTAMEETLPGVEELTGRLLDLGAGNIDDLGPEFDSLGASIDRITAEGRIDHSLDALRSLLSLGQLESSEKAGARNELEALDEALTNVATNAGPAAAEAALVDLAEAQGLSADQVDRLKTQLPAYNEALEGAANDAQLAAASTKELGGAAEVATGAMTAFSTMTEGEAKLLKESRDAARDTGEAFFGLGEKVDKAKVSLGEWIRDMEKQAAALREFQHNAIEAGRKGLSQGLIDELEAAGTTGALRMKQLADATEAEIGRANRAWRSGQRAIEDWTDFAGGVPPASIRVNNDPALIGIKEIEKRLRDLKDKTLTVRLTYSGTAALSPGFGAQGGFAGGGWTGPGGKYQPKGVVHGDEYVFSKEATHGNVAMLERLHHQLRGYAQGGLVQRHATAPVMSAGGGRLEVDYQRLAQTLATVRPLYGDVHLSGDDSFRRELRADRRRAGLGGV